MTASTVARRALFGVACLLFLVLAFNGLVGGVGQLHDANTPGRQIETATQMAYGLFALLSLVTTFRARHWAPLLLTSFAISASVAGGLASVVWGESGVGTGVLSGFAALAVTLVMIWMLRAGARGLARG